tara:strand:- start:189 stop:578 length:390 start_codon:yes stop_codon:yes gene_type:complete
MEPSYSMMKNKKSNNIELYFEGKFNTFSIILSHMEDDKNFWRATSLYPNIEEEFGAHNQEFQYYFLRINSQFRISSDFKLYLIFLQQNPDNIYSGNISKQGSFTLEKNISLFEKFLDMKIIGELKILSI